MIEGCCWNAIASSTLMNGDIACGDTDDRDNLSDEITLSSSDKTSTCIDDVQLQQQLSVEMPEDDLPATDRGVLLTTLCFLIQFR